LYTFVHPSQIDINGHSLGIVAEALGGSNIGNCPHACVARPCGPLAECVPQMESYECRCSIHNERCNKAAEVPPEQLPELALHKSKVLETKDNGEAVKKVSGLAHKKHSKKHRNLHKLTPAKSTSSTTTTTTTTTSTTSTENPEGMEAATAGALSNEEIEDDIIFRFVQQQQQQKELKEQQQTSTPAPSTSTASPKPKAKPRFAGKHHASKHEHHQKPNAAFTHKLSRLPTHYESFQTNPDSDILTFEDNNDWVASLQQQEYGDAMAASQSPLIVEDGNPGNPQSSDSNNNNNEEDDENAFVFDESLFDASDGTEEYQRKQLAQDMKRIMSNSNAHSSHKKAEVQFPSQPSPDGGSPIEDTSQYSDDYNDDELLTPVLQAGEEVKSSTPQTHTDWSLLKKFDLSAEHQTQIQGVRKNFGACFAGSDSYFHYNDADTMSQVISYSIDLNLRIKTHSENGVILWTGRQGTTEEHDDYLSLGIEQG